MRSRRKLWKKFMSLLRVEIAVEYKSCLYFACILFFYFAYLMMGKIYYASILFMFEMIMSAYVMSYLQIYLFRDSDGADRLGAKEAAGILVCTCLYGGCSFRLGWFGESLLAALVFSGYMLLVYLCVYFLNKVKRALDTEHLNRMLAEFKEKGTD